MPSLSELGLSFLKDVRSAMTGQSSRATAEYDQYGNPVVHAQTPDITARTYVVAPGGEFDAGLDVSIKATLTSGDQRVVIGMDTNSK